MTRRHSGGQPVAELLEKAAEQDWHTSLIGVHARRRPRVPAPRPVYRPDPPTQPMRRIVCERPRVVAEQRRPGAEFWFGPLDELVEAPALVRPYMLTDEERRRRAASRRSPLQAFERES